MEYRPEIDYTKEGDLTVKKWYVVVSMLLLLVSVSRCGREGRILKIARQLEAAFNSHDPITCAERYTQDALYVVVGRDKPLRGREEIEASFRQTFNNFPDIRAEFTNIIVSGDTFIVEGTSRGSYHGKPIEYSYAFFAEVTSDGLIAEDRTYIDSASLQRQMALPE